MNDNLVVVCIFTSLIAVVIVGLIGDTLIELTKEETARACFEAAKVNPTITCEVKE